MANDIADLLLRIDASTEGLRREIKRAESAVQGGASEIEKNTKKIDKSFDGMSRGVSTSLRLVGTALAAMGLQMSVSQVVKYADAWQNATNQLKTVQRDTENLADTQSKLMGVANETRAGFETTANLYTRLSRSTENLNLSQGELIDLTETINKSFAVSGASAQEASNAIIQLSQGLAAGALRGEEFNSVSEQSPILMQAIADHLQMTRGELRDFAAEGGITAEIVVKSLQEASGEIDSTFGKMAATFEQNMTVAKNNMLEFVGSSETVQRVTGATGSAIVAISENIDELGRLAAAAGVGIGALGAVHLVRLAGSLNLATVAQVAFNRAAMLNPYVALGVGITALSYGLMRYTENQKEATKALTDYVRATTILDPLKAAVLEKFEANQQALDAERATTEVLSTVTRELTDEMRKAAVVINHGTNSTESQTEAVNTLIESLSVVRMSYADNIAMMNQSAFVMQGVTAATRDAAAGVDFWTKVAQQGAARRTEAENRAAEESARNFERTHEYITQFILDSESGGNAIERLGDLAVQTAKRIAAEWLALKAMNLFGISMPGMGGTGAAGSVGGGIMSSVIGKGASAVGSAVSGGFATGGIGGAVSGGAGAIASGAGAIPGWGWALGGAALLASQLDQSTPSGNAGLLIHDAPGAPADQKFAVDPFASGFAPVGFARREDQAAANQVIDIYRQYDAALTQIANAAGIQPNFSNNPFGGYDENAQGNGLFLGVATEDGKTQGVTVEKQLDHFVGQWIDALGGQITPEERAIIKSAGSADAMIAKAAQLAGIDGSHRNGLDYVPFDGYRAELHRGERVMTASENAATSGMAGEFRMMRQELIRIAQQTKRTSDILLRVTRNGEALLTEAV